MGRGRAKAKQTKVARELKYHSPNTDLAALQRELAGSELSSGSGSAVVEEQPDDDEPDPYDPYGNYAVDDDDDDDGKDWTPRR
ncbi:hypothetical protein Cme02nite_23200 [Catellatospora methionotrophica]|uniref:DUF3073 domain-containing protein n=1 Tax=Catellatospora methionotrophica TaxID=121620 RepID=A0A8J3L444_9ACTN|nr:DUF3073 domain-containing protein [Catellatospora methionotrophica]GIG13988.1 hypothetical protein Cme02nite_23200 [Catellatospora methionotrophica]